MTIAQKKGFLSIGKEMLHKYIPGALKDVYKIVVGDALWYETERTQQSTLRVLEDEPNPKKFVRGRWSPISSAKLVIYRLFHLIIVER